MRRLFFVFLLCALPLQVSAQSPGVTIDLNKLEPVEGACRVYLVLENDTEQDFTAFTLDLYVFGPDGVIDKRLAVSTVPLTPGKTRVRPVDVRDTGCDAIARVLVNDVLDCQDASGTRNDCVDLLALKTHAEIEFIK